MVATVSKLRYAEGFEWLQPVDARDFDRLRFDGRPALRAWSPIPMKRIVISGKGEQLQPCDFPACSGGDMLFVNSAARDAVGRALEAHGELLPLVCETTPYWAFNVTNMVDALDVENSQVLRASDSGRVLLVMKHVFRPEVLGESAVFKLPETPRGLIYVRESFVRLVESTSLLGLRFQTVWP